MKKQIQIQIKTNGSTSCEYKIKQEVKNETYNRELFIRSSYRLTPNTLTKKKYIYSQKLQHTTV